MGRRLQSQRLKRAALFLLVVFICGTTVYFSGTERNYFDSYDKESDYGHKRTGSRLMPAIYNRNDESKPKFSSQKLSYGSHLQFRQLDQDSNNLSSCQASGEGLHHARVGTVASLTVSLDGTRLQDFNQNLFINIIAVSKDHIFVVDFPSIRSGVRNVNVSYTPTLPGNYDLYVEEILSESPWRKQVPGSPFRLMVQGSSEAIDEFIALADKLPSCQTVPQYDLSWIEGSWVSSRLKGRKHGILPSGWVFQPKGCSFDIFTTDEIRKAATSISPKSIAILGSSSERGIFLSLIEILLTNSEKEYIKDSYLENCWGYMEVEFGNLRIIYKDFRIKQSRRIYLVNDTKAKIVCYEQLELTSDNDFRDDVLGFLDNFIFSKHLWPDVIAVAIEGDPQLRLLKSAVPDSWVGLIYPLNSFTNNWAPIKDSERYITALTELATVDSRVHVLDGFILAAGAKYVTHYNPSSRKNRFCEDLTGDAHICEVAIEMVAHIFIAQILAPHGKDPWT